MVAALKSRPWRGDRARLAAEIHQPIVENFQIELPKPIGGGLCLWTSIAGYYRGCYSSIGKPIYWYCGWLFSR